MGLLDDIRKLRERADNLNNNLKSPPRKNTEEAASKFSRTPFESRLQKSYIKTETADTKETAALDSIYGHKTELLGEGVKEYKKPLNQEKINKPSNGTSFFNKRFNTANSQKKEHGDLKESFYNSLTVKVLLIFSALIIIFLLLKIEQGETNLDRKSKISRLSSKTVPNDNQAYYLSKGLIICSGSFKSPEEANLQLNRIKKITEQNTKLVQIADYYTIQIGDYYFSKDDAFYVFSELSAMGLLDLSIRSI